MAPDAAALLWDALTAGRAAVSYAAGLDFEAYQAHGMASAAIERKLEIVGEALGQLRKVDPVTAALIPELPAAVGLRNILIHAYGSVDHRLVWDVVSTHLPALLNRLVAMLPAGD